MTTSLKKWVHSGSPWIWLNAAAVTICVLLVVGLLTLIAWRGLGHFWPKAVFEVALQTPSGSALIAGQVADRETVSASRLRESGVELELEDGEVVRTLYKVGNRDVLGQDFRWILEPRVVSRSTPPDLLVLERLEWGNFIGRLVSVEIDGQRIDGADARAAFDQGLARAEELREQIDELERDEIGSINYRLERLRLERRELELEGVPAGDDRYQRIDEREQELQARYARLESDLIELNEAISRDVATLEVVSGEQRDVRLRYILDAYWPNDMSLGEQLKHYVSKVWSFVSEDPREANTEGGIFPAIFGTVLMVLLMSILVTPFGVVAAVYLKEYAKQGLLTRTIRVAVNNLAGVPSIVYGVFGLGFFVYTVGGTLDEWFFEAALPSPTLGTGGLIWASLTLALLTLPVVIVSSEEALARIPRTIREGSLALGATRWETLWRTILPMASPGIMTGMILAVARAAGEVAPLMLVGVVKLAPSLPLDGNYPFLHPERKFMHLGFHIYDVGFQSPNVEAARPLVYATALLLVIITVLLNLVAIRIRNHLREKYRGME